MRKVLFIIFVFCVYFSYAQENTSSTVEQWSRYETSLKGAETGNPFTDVWLTATFSNGNKKIKANGFYDGNGSYKIRFMPTETGECSIYTGLSIKQKLSTHGT